MGQTETPEPRRSRRLHERSRELERVAVAIEAAAAGTGGLLVLEGPAGIGKTALLQAVRERAAEHGMAVLSAGGSELERDSAFGVIRQLLEPRLTSASERERARLLRGAAALAAPLLLGADTGTGPASPEPEHAALHGLYWLTAGLAAEQPVVIAVDDAHWSDDPSLRFLLYLARRLEGLPVLLAVAIREGEPGAPLELLDPLAEHVLADLVQPSSLSEQAAGEVMAELLDAPVDGRLRHACFEATGGNPFLLHALALELAGREPDGAEDLAAVVGRVAPSRLARAIGRRMARLGPEAPALARAVAVLDQHAELELTAALAEVDVKQARGLAAALAGAGILQSGEPLAFVHPIVRGVIERGIPAEQRSRAHAVAFRLLRSGEAAPETLASHLLVAAPAGDSDALETLLLAGRRAAAQGAPDQAVAYLERALAEPPPAELRHELLLELGRAEMNRRSPAAERRLREALECAPPGPARAITALELGRALTVGEQLAAAVEVLQRAVAELGDADRQLALALEAAVISAANLDGSLRAMARERVARIDRSIEPRGLPECMLLALVAVESALQGESAEETVAAGERALAGGLLVEYDAMTLGYVGSALSFAGRLEPSAGVLGDGLEAARRRGAPLSVAVLAAMRSHVLLVCGRVPDAEAHARTSIELASAYGPHVALGFAAAFLADALLERGDLEGAEEALAQGMALRATAVQYSQICLLDSRGRLRLEQGRVREALEDFLECGRRHAEWGGYNPALVQWQGHAGVAHALLGDPERGRELARDDVVRARRFGADWLVGATLRVLAAVESPERRIETLRTAVAELEGTEAGLEQARAVADLGVALLEGSAAREAREPLRKALDSATRCGATGLAERAEDALRAAGGRPRRVALSGEAALTSTERRLVRLASRLSNREIAESEFVTLKTVEFHLRNAYRKLGVAGRHELDTALAKDSGPS